MLSTERADLLPAGLSVRNEPVQQRSVDRVTHLLDAAADLIDERGIDGLTTSDVATRSASSVGVVYRYFPNIQSLLRALAARNMEKFITRIFGAMTDSTDEWMVALDSAIDTYVDLCRNEPGFRALGELPDQQMYAAPLPGLAPLADQDVDVSWAEAPEISVDRVIDAMVDEPSAATSGSMLAAGSSRVAFEGTPIVQPRPRAPSRPSLRSVLAAELEGDSELDVPTFLRRHSANPS